MALIPMNLISSKISLNTRWSKPNIPTNIGDTLEIDLFTDKGLKVIGNIEVLFDNPLGLTIHQNVITGATLEGLTYFYLLYEVSTNGITYTIMSDLVTLEVKQNR